MFWRTDVTTTTISYVRAAASVPVRACVSTGGELWWYIIMYTGDFRDFFSVRSFIYFTAIRSYVRACVCDGSDLRACECVCERVSDDECVIGRARTLVVTNGCPTGELLLLQLLSGRWRRRLPAISERPIVDIGNGFTGRSARRGDDRLA